MGWSAALGLGVRVGFGLSKGVRGFVFAVEGVIGVEDEDEDEDEMLEFAWLSLGGLLEADSKLCLSCA